ncbi:hypothetical protein BO71DRAFT_305176, partial [Aspergillus ellipticus CBS 707.79]
TRWQSLIHRTSARTAHLPFIYAVKSTQIYCRPTCPARLARRANIIFYDTTGFVGEKEQLVARVIALLRVRTGDQIGKRSLREVAREVGVSPSYLCRAFRGVMGV